MFASYVPKSDAADAVSESDTVTTEDRVSGAHPRVELVLHPCEINLNQPIGNDPATDWVTRSSGSRLLSYAPNMPLLPIELEDEIVPASEIEMETIPVPDLMREWTEASNDNRETRRPTGDTEVPFVQPTLIRNAG